MWTCGQGLTPSNVLDKVKWFFFFFFSCCPHHSLYSLPVWGFTLCVWMFGFGGGAGEWWGGRAFGDDMSFYQPLEALHHDGGECRWGEVVIERCNCGGGFFWHWYCGSSLETWWDNSEVLKMCLWGPEPADPPLPLAPNMEYILTEFISWVKTDYVLIQIRDTLHSFRQLNNILARQSLYSVKRGSLHIRTRVDLLHPHT